MATKNGVPSRYARGKNFSEFTAVGEYSLILQSSNFSIRHSVTLSGMLSRLSHWMSTVGLLAQQSGRDTMAAQLILGRFGFLEHIQMLAGVMKIKKLRMSASPGKFSCLI